jgi:hypothetical protein
VRLGESPDRLEILAYRRWVLKRLGPFFAAAALLAGGLSPAAQADDELPPPVEDYASYDPQTTCAKQPKPGTVVLGQYLVATYGGGGGAVNRGCKSGGTSEHKDGRAIDWTLNAAVKSDRLLAKRFLTEAFATDEDGNAHALARRMGIMYVIWNDHMYSAWDQFEREDYLSSGCRSRNKCSATLRHRNHMHISLSRPGSRGETSWYLGRL